MSGSTAQSNRRTRSPLLTYPSRIRFQMLLGRVTSTSTCPPAGTGSGGENAIRAALKRSGTRRVNEQPPEQVTRTRAGPLERPLGERTSNELITAPPAGQPSAPWTLQKPRAG